MSSLGDIAKAALRPARAMLGPSGVSSWLTIASGERWEGTKAEERRGRDYVTGGQQEEVTHTFVGETAAFELLYSSASKEYLGKAASVDGTSYTISAINKGEVFTEIELIGEEEAG